MVKFENLSSHHFLNTSGEADEEGGQRKNKPAEVRKELILQIVKGHPDGIRVQSIAEAIENSAETVRSALKELEKEREVYHRTHGKGNAQIWYPNGRLVHPHLELYVELRGTTYRVTVQEARTGPAVQIQERSYSLVDGERVEGAIFVDYSSLEDFIEALQDIEERYETFQDTQQEMTR